MQGTTEFLRSEETCETNALRKYTKIQRKYKEMRGNTREYKEIERNTMKQKENQRKHEEIY